MALLAVVPAITLLMVWTNETHGLIWSSVELDTSGQFSILDLTYGWGFLVNIGSAYIWLILGSALLLQALVRSQHLYRRQAVILLVGVLAPWVGTLYTSQARALSPTSI